MTQVSSNDIKKDVEQLKGFVKETQSSYNRITSDIYNNVGQPLMDNDISSKIQQGMFHTTAGRSITMSYLKFNRQVVAALSTFFGFSMYEFAKYCISLSTDQTAGMVTNLFVSFVLLFVASTILEIQEQLITDRMGGTNIVEYTEEDIELLKRKR